MPDSPVISGVADLPKFYFAEGAPFKLTLTIGAEFSMTGKFVTFGMRARSGTVRRVFGTDSGESNLTIAGQVITLNIATSDATVPAFASGWTLEDVQTKGETEYWVDISATEGSDVLLRLQGQADWVTAGSDIPESSAVVASPAIDVTINNGAVAVDVAVLGANEMSAAAILTAIKTVDGTGSGLDADLLDGQHGSNFATAANLTSHTSATTGAHGISAFGATLVDDADASVARTTLGLGDSATKSVGTTAGTVAAGDDSRLSDTRTPTAHKASHATGGSDALSASDIGAATTAQGAKADTAVQPNTTPTLSGVALTGPITKASSGALIGSSVSYAGIVGIRPSTNEIYIGDATNPHQYVLLGSIGFGTHTGVQFFNSGGCAWVSDNVNAGSGTRDTRLLREQAGMLKVTTDSSSTYADLKARDLIASQYFRPASYTVSAANALSSPPEGAAIYVSNESGGACWAYYRSGWKRFSDNAAIS
jgi:hypothetical protein